MKKYLRDAIMCAVGAGLYLLSAVILAMAGHPLTGGACLFLTFLGLRDAWHSLRRYREGRRRR